jgi:hypothetical protein
MQLPYDPDHDDPWESLPKIVWVITAERRNEYLSVS